MVGPPASTSSSATQASVMLSKNSQQKIKTWAGYTKHDLDELIPKDKRSLRERLTEVVSASLKESTDHQNTIQSTPLGILTGF